MGSMENAIEAKDDGESDEIKKKQEHAWLDNIKSHSNLVFDSHIELKVIQRLLNSKFFHH